MFETITQEDWNGLYYSVGLGKFFTVDVGEKYVRLKNIFNSSNNREFEPEYFTHFVENSEFIEVGNQPDERYRTLYEQKIIDIEREIKKLRQKRAGIKSGIKMYKKQALAAFEQNRYQISFKSVETCKLLESRLDKIDKTIYALEQKEQEFKLFRNKIQNTTS